MDQVGSKPAIPGLEVRALKNEVERNAYFQMHARIFRDREEIEEVAGARRDLITGEPLFAPEQMRGAFLNGQLVGGYMQLKRVLCIDEAQFSTGCISGVWTDPDVRKQGIASALMQEAIPFAAEQGHSLLLLEGIPNFYHRFGHIDVCEFMTEQLIDRAKLASLPASPYTIRPLTQADAPALLELYRKEQGGSPVNFVSSRTMEIEEHLLSDWFEVLEGPSVVAVSPENRVEGYLMLAHHWGRVK
jgi:predicted N-acetyltransferase YhbS